MRKQRRLKADEWKGGVLILFTFYLLSPCCVLAADSLGKTASDVFEATKSLTREEQLSQARKTIAAISSTLKAHPKDSASYCLRAKLYRKIGESGKALDDLNRAILIDPRNSDAHFERAKIYKEQKKLRQALADLSRGIGNASGHTLATLLFERAKIYRQLKKGQLCLKPLKIRHRI